MATSTVPTTDTATSIELQLRDLGCFFVGASAELDCRIELEHVVRRSDGRLLEYFTLEDADPDAVLALSDGADVIDDARLVNEGVDAGLFEFLVSGPCVTTTLADAGAIARSVCAKSGNGRVLADVPAHVETRGVVEGFREDYSGTDLLACRSADSTIPIQTERGASTQLVGELTAKQLEVLRTAYRLGYFSWPRRTGAEECAAALGIAQPTFSQHLRVAQQKVFAGLFEEEEAQDRRTRPIR